MPSKVHALAAGQVSQPDKRFCDLSRSDQERIDGWLYEGYLMFCKKNHKEPHGRETWGIADGVMGMVDKAGIAMSETEVRIEFFAKRSRFKNRMRKEQAKLGKEGSVWKG